MSYISKLKTILLILLALALFSCKESMKKHSDNQVSKVELIQDEGQFILLKNGIPFYIQGAGFEGKDPSSVAKYGGNAIRTWRTSDEFLSGQEMLDAAHQNGLMVCLGIEIGRERHGFDYNDSNMVLEQFERIKADVMRYKDHPALLAWGIGNELNLHYSNFKVWDAVEEISLMIHKLDPNHPTTTMLAGAGKKDIHEVLSRAPSLNFLSFQLYGDIINLPRYLKEANYKGAYVVSEWGATGHWEVGLTSWKRPYEQNTHEKAESYRNRYQTIIVADQKQCIGSFVFLWGQKQERTPTWYGMFLESGEKTESVDVMQFMWTGNFPENRAPQLIGFSIEEMTDMEEAFFKPGQIINLLAEVIDPDNDQLFFMWEIIPEVPEEKQSDGGDFEPRPESFLKETTEVSNCKLKLPELAGDYRIFVYAFDSKGNAASANIPIFIQDNQ